MVDAIVHEWLQGKLGNESARDGIGATIHLVLALFYTNDGYIALMDVAMLQKAMDTIIQLFERVGLRTNTSKTKGQTCVDGKIRTRLLVHVYYRSCAVYET